MNAERCGLRAFDQTAVRELVRFGSRLTGRQDRLSTRLGLVADLCAEANQFANDDGAAQVTAAHVIAASASRERRSSLVPDRIRRLIREGTLHVETSGSVVGQVNGLAVFVTGDHAFGVPMRITCRTGAGQQGVVDIERETERSGSIHTKGVLVLNGYLMGTFGRDHPLAFNASLTFEQSYDEVEGDSASSAELYAILTSLADVPVRQDIAVTGSVDQFGNVQAVGGVTEKVEGFFDICREIGLTGTQGVILPASNVRNLVLRNEVIEAVERGEFHLWAVEQVEEGLEILTGLSPRPQPGKILGSSLFERVEAALEQMRKAAARPLPPNGRRISRWRS
jgi:predicted ATP-dependent protease